MARSNSLPQVRYETILLKGGLDLVTPTLDLPPGVARDGLNMECNVTGGYTRIAGYERVDGHPSPSAATYIGMTVTGSTSPALLSTITGNSSGATGVLFAQDATTFFITKQVGIFTLGELLKVSGSTVGTYTGPGQASTAKLDAQYFAAAADVYRADISKMPGSGPARGACILNDVLYGFRDNAGGTACILYKATSSGWTVVPLFLEVAFTAGTGGVPADGATLTQNGVTALVKRAVLQAGAWAGSPGTAAGTLIITTLAGGNFASGSASLTGGVTVTLSGVQTQIVLLPGGKYDLDVFNFAGSASTARMYGADGVNRMFEFDGTTFVPIATGTSPDTPSMITQHRNHLFGVFGASMVHSAPGLPYNFTAQSGAAEIAVGDNITNLLVQPGAQTTGTMEVTTGTTTWMLYGTGAASWNFVPYNIGTGAIAWTAQNMAQSYALDNRGVMGLQTTLAYGNFQQTSLTQNIRSFVQQERTKTTASTLCREKSQYRLFFNDGYALYLTSVNNQYLGAFPVLFSTITDGTHYGFFQVWEGVLTTGEEVIYGCGYDGHVYQMEKGTSFDGANIDWYVQLNFDQIQSPRILKRFLKMAIEIQGTTYTEVLMSYMLGYGNLSIAQAAAILYPSNFTSAKWDSMNWDHFFWDGQTLIPTEAEMIGTGENVAVTLSGTGNYSKPFTINSLILSFIMRRGIR